MKSIDALVKNLLKYAKRPEWRRELTGVWHEHLETAGDYLEMPAESLAQVIDEKRWHDHLFGLVFEDFSTRRPVEGSSFANHYLKRAGWRESSAARRYLEAMAKSRLGLYEVVDVKREQGLKLRDLIDAGPTIFVHEKSATRTLTRWDVLAARVIERGEEQVLTGGIMVLNRDAANALLDQLIPIESSEPTPDFFESGDDQDPPALHLPMLVTTFWLAAAVAGLRKGEFSNAEGEPLLFGKARLPLQTDADEVSQLLDAADDWGRTAVNPPSWVFLGGSETDAERKGGRYRVINYGPDGRVILGEAELTAGDLLFSTNSHGRMERGLARLREMLGARVGAAQTVYRTLNDLRDKDQDEGPDLEVPLPADEVERIRQEFLNRHYRETMRSHIPALGDRTPKQAMRSKAGRRRVIEWLKLMEQSEARRASATGEEAYDFTWMWQELGLLSERDECV